MADLIELLKSSIDHDHMITSILIDGKGAGRCRLERKHAKYATSHWRSRRALRIEYARKRLGTASGVVRECFLDFREARKCFQAGDMQPGNKHMVRAVNTLQAFFHGT